MASYVEILFGIAAVFFALYYYFTSTFDFWEIRGVIGPRPIPLFGNMKDIIFARIFMGDYLRKLYEKYRNQPMIGMFARRTPFLVLRDADLIKDVLIRDFSKFSDRGTPVPEKAEPLSPHLFTESGDTLKDNKGRKFRVASEEALS